MKKHIANIITSCRILCSIILLFLPPFSTAFYLVYILCGFTDIIDGTIARQTNSVSDFGAKFDSIADIVFVAVSMFKMLPVTDIPRYMWIWIIAIAIIKISNIILKFIKNKKFISYHTAMNKIAGLLLFLLPLTLYFIELKYSGAVVCLVATFAAIQEGFCAAKSQHLR